MMDRNLGFTGFTVQRTAFGTEPPCRRRSGLQHSGLNSLEREYLAGGEGPGLGRVRVCAGAGGADA